MTWSLYSLQRERSLTGERERLSYAEVAVELGISEAPARQAGACLRSRYRELLRVEVAHTVGEPDPWFVRRVWSDSPIFRERSRDGFRRAGKSPRLSGPVWPRISPESS